MKPYGCNLAIAKCAVVEDFMRLSAWGHPAATTWAERLDLALVECDLLSPEDALVEGTRVLARAMKRGKR